MDLHVCPTCAVGLVNDDWSSVDCKDTYTSILAWLEMVGYLVHVKQIDKGGYYDCECCGEIAIGTAHVFQPII